MTYIVDTGVAALHHSQNHSGSVPIPTPGMPARPIPEDSFPESEGLPGSRETPRIRHRRIRGPHRHHLPDLVAGTSAAFEGEGLRVRAEHLLLRDLSTLPQPGRTGAGLGQHGAQFREVRFPAGLLLAHGFVPQKSAAMPFLDEGAFGECARPQSVLVAHHLGPHVRHDNRAHRHGVLGPTRLLHAAHLLEGGRRFLSPVNEGVSAPNTR